MKLNCGKTFKDEVKLKDLTEEQYIFFLQSLRKLNGILFCTSTDMSLISNIIVINHRDTQAQKVVEHKNKMIHKSARTGLEDLSAQIKELSPQLYMQLVCQINLIADVISRSILYYVQRNPKILCRFKWRIDQKNTKKTRYEDAFSKMAPSLLQTMSLEHPSIRVEEFDYSAISEFVFTKENAPDYLSADYGLDIDITEALNLGKVLRDDFAFHDSKSNIGIQIVDLLASGLKRALRGEFTNVEEISKLLGSLMVQAQKNNVPMNLISFTEGVVNN